MPDDVVGGARIRIEPDFTGFDEALEAGVQQAADQAAEAIVAAFRQAAATSAQELSDIGQAGLVDVTSAADVAATDIEAAFAAAAGESDEVLGSIGSGAADEIAGQFTGIGDEIADEFVGVGAAISGDIEAGAADAQASLEGLGSGTGDSLAAEFSGVGEAISTNVQNGANEASAGLAALEGAGQGVVENLTEGFSGLGGVIAALAGGFALGSVFSAGERVQSIIGVTNTLIETTGGVANVSAAEILALGDSLENLTGIESELTQEAENVLLTFKNVRNEVGEGNDIFNRAVIAGADLSTVLGGEITGSALQLGKALQDPIRGMSLLGRAGVQFTTEQKELIRSLVEEGDLLAAQKVILGEVEGQVGGAAEAAAKASDRIRASLGNIAEEIGVGLLPAADELADALPGIVEDVAPQAQELGEALGSVLDLLVDGFLAVSPLIGVTTDLLLVLMPVLETAVDLLDAIPDPLLQAAAAFVLFNKVGGALGPTITNLRLVLQITQAVAASRGISTAAAGMEAIRARSAGAVSGLRSVTTGLSGASLAAGLGLTAMTLYSDMLANARAEGEEFGQSIRESFDLTAMSAEELASLSDTLGTEIENLRGQVDDSFFGRNTINKDFNESIEAGADELARFQDEVIAARAEMLRLEAEAQFGDTADRFVGIADSLANVRAESGDAADAISAFRLTGDDADSTMLALATTLKDAELSEEGMADAAQTLGVDVEALQGFIDDTTGSLQTFIDTAVSGMPTVADAFRDSNEDSKVSAREFITGLEDDAADLADFFGDLRTIVDAGFTEVAGVLAEQGSEIAGQAADELAAAAREGNTKLLQETQEGLDARDAAIIDSAAFLTGTLGPQYVEATGLVAANASAAFGEGFDIDEQVRIATELAKTTLDEDGQRVAAIAASVGESAARSFGRGLGLSTEAIDAAVAAGTALRKNAPYAEASRTGVDLGTALVQGFAFALLQNQTLVNDKASQLVLQAEAAARRAAQARSPSQLFAALGNDLAEGIALGLDEAGVEVLKATEQIINEAARAVSSETISIGANVSTDPSMRPLVAAAASVSASDSGSGSGGSSSDPRQLIIERLVLPSTEPEQAASAIIEGMVAITTVVGTR